MSLSQICMSLAGAAGAAIARAAPSSAWPSPCGILRRAALTLLVAGGAGLAATPQAFACSFGAVTSHNLGTNVASLTPARTSTSRVEVNTLSFTCSISADWGQGGGGPAARYMTGPGGYKIAYQLYRDAAYTIVRGTDLLRVPFGFNARMLYAKTLATQIPIKGVFRDTVTMRLHWLGVVVATRSFTVTLDTTDLPPRPEGLKGVAVPTPSNLNQFVANRGLAVALGKALFWDMQLGSDGKTACASCHFHAGADNRSRNQINPGTARASSPTVANPDTTFQIGGPNYQSSVADYPFFQRLNPDDPSSPITRNVNEITSSQGVLLSRFVSATPGASEDNFQLRPDPVFNVGGTNTRRVEPRNTPTTINAVFNFRNFWDGRAQFLFNGVNPFGARDPNARVFSNASGTVTPVQVRIDNASLASQAVGPPISIFEMSADGRTLMDIGKRLLTARPLGLQTVSPQDSVLGSYANSSGKGMTVSDYGSMIQAAFRPEWWNGSQAIQIDAAGNKTVIPMPGTLAANQYTQMQANFSLFFGLAVQLYESTLVSDDSPFDRYMAGNTSAMNATQIAGMNLFFGKGRCANCHGGAEFTNASVRKTLRQPIERMVMGDGGVAAYDVGFYNISVTPTLEDILNGGRDAFSLPLSNSALLRQVGSATFQQMIGVSPSITLSANERIAVMGAAKTPTVRNAELTQPFFHNGGALTLRQMLEVYNRGGNFPAANRPDLDADIVRLGLTQTEKDQIAAFIKALTDDRVRRDAAPFDHPELAVPNGHVGDRFNVQTANGRAVDQTIVLPAIGASGYGSTARPNFLNVVE